MPYHHNFCIIHWKYFSRNITCTTYLTCLSHAFRHSLRFTIFHPTISTANEMFILFFCSPLLQFFKWYLGSSRETTTQFSPTLLRFRMNEFYVLLLSLFTWKENEKNESFWLEIIKKSFLFSLHTSVGWRRRKQNVK